MLPSTIFRRASSLRSVCTLAMQQTKRTNYPRRGGWRGGGRSNMSSAAAAAVQQEQPSSSFASSSAPRSPSPMDGPAFSDLARNNLINPVLLKTVIEDLKFSSMTAVQEATISHLLTKDQDMVAQARTGTGKTVAFLIPGIQRMLNETQKVPRGHVSLLVVSPTRELAIQIANDAKALLQRMPDRKVCTAIGGTNKNSEDRKIMAGCDILVGTPGRLQDHLKNEDGSPSLLAERLKSVKTLVLDEADRLLDMGFLNDLQKIIAYLPKKDRQSMLFSATVPNHVAKVSKVALRDNYEFISTIPKGEAGTHERVPQQLVVVPSFSKLVTGLIGCLRQEMEIAGPNKFKAIVFAPTAALVDFYVAVLQKMSGLPKVEGLHSRLSQSRRTNIAAEYKKAQNGVLIATDVIARGMDFPAVTNVFQVGLSDAESYVHRLGRTARAGAEGRGTFIIAQPEEFFPRRVLKDIKFEEAPADLSAHNEVLSITERFEPSMKSKTYQAWLGFYKTSAKPMGWSMEKLVSQANAFAMEGLRCEELPTIKRSTAGKMGLRDVPGLNTVKDPPQEGRGGYGGGKRQRFA